MDSHCGVQLAVDTTLASAVQGDGVVRRGAANRDGRERAPKEGQDLPELVEAGARARLVVLALEVGGRWSREASRFVKLLANAKWRSEPVVVQRRMEQAWRLWRSSTLACVAARFFAGSLLGLRGGHGADGKVPHSHDVECVFSPCGIVWVNVVGD